MPLFDVDENNAINVLESVFPELPVKNYTVITTGWDNIVIQVNNETAFKIPRKIENAQQLKREVSILSCISDSPVRVPRLSHLKEYGNSLIMGYDFIPGRSLNSVKKLSGVMVDQLITFLNYLYDKKDDLCVMNSMVLKDSSFWGRRYEQYRESVFSNLFDVLNDDTLSAIATEFDSFLGDYCRTVSVSPIHGDLYRDNVIVELDNPAIAGVVDWGTADYGDPAIDFAALAVDFSIEDIENMILSYKGPVDENFHKRLMFYWKLEPIYGIMYFMNRDEKALEVKINELTTRLMI